MFSAKTLKEKISKACSIFKVYAVLFMKIDLRRVNVLKNIFALFLTVLILFVSSGCNNSVGDEIEPGAYNNSVIPIYDADSREIGSIECFYYSAFVNGSILYTKLPENAKSEETLEYWLYNIQTQNNYKLAAIDGHTYSAAYEAIEYNDHMYLSVFTGEFAGENSKQTIYDIDLLEYSMSPILEIKGGIPYNSYTIANNKLVVAELLYNGYTDLIEYDLSEAYTSTVVHTYNETDYFVENSIRHIFADDSNIYMVRLAWNETDDYSLWLDTYDFDYSLLNTVDISDFCVSTDVKRTEDSKINEWKQFIAYFFVHNDLIYYQNFSTTNAIGVAEDAKINRLLNTNALFAYANSVSKSDDNDLFIQSNGDDTDNRNIFYLINSKTHAVETAEFFADNRDYTFTAAFRDGNKILLTMGYVPYDVGERLPDRLYYIDMNDLDFKPM